jgi:hypothetical protein
LRTTELTQRALVLDRVVAFGTDDVRAGATRFGVFARTLAVGRVRVRVAERGGTRAST